MNMNKYGSYDGPNTLGSFRKVWLKIRSNWPSGIAITSPRGLLVTCHVNL